MTSKKKASELKLVITQMANGKEVTAAHLTKDNVKEVEEFIILGERSNCAVDVHAWIKDLLTEVQHLSQRGDCFRIDRVRRNDGYVSGKGKN